MSACGSNPAGPAEVDATPGTDDATASADTDSDPAAPTEDSGGTGPDGTTASDTHPSDAAPTDTSPTDTSPTDTSPTDTSPADTSPTDTSPTDTGPTDTSPTDTGPTDTSPTDTSPTDTDGNDIQTSDTDPADTSGADIETSDTGSTDTTDTSLDTSWGDPCDPPLRLRPTRGPTTGGTLVEVAGSEFYVGALAWWLDLGDHVIGESSWVFGTPCTLYFVTQPTPPSTRDARVYYGGPEGTSREVLPVGTFTFVDDRTLVSRGPCRTDGDCDGDFEVCHTGLDACIVNRCTGAVCGGGWLGGPCDPLRGCVDPGECSTDADCKLLYSSCSCLAVPRTDRRAELDPCTYDGCAECVENSCVGDGVVPRCEASVCVARPGV